MADDKGSLELLAVKLHEQDNTSARLAPSRWWDLPTHIRNDYRVKAKILVHEHHEAEHDGDLWLSVIEGEKGSN